MLHYALERTCSGGVIWASGCGLHSRKYKRRSQMFGWQASKHLISSCKRDRTRWSTSWFDFCDRFAAGLVHGSLVNNRPPGSSSKTGLFTSSPQFSPNSLPGRKERRYASSMLKTVFKVVLVVAAIILFVGDPFSGALLAVSQKKKP